MLFLFTSFPESVTSAVILHPVELFCFQQLILVLTFPQHTPSEASSSAGDCPLLRSLAL